MFHHRRSGILMHITSLPSRWGIGDLGPQAYRFADWLQQAGQGVWQVLPMSPITRRGHFSPYDSPSAFAGNPLLISPELLCDEGLLERDELPAEPRDLPASEVDFRRAGQLRRRLLLRACQRFAERLSDADFGRFCRQSSGWLEDFALFTALRDHLKGKLWTDWPTPLRDRQPAALKALAAELQQPIQHARIEQYLFHRQYRALQRYCHERDIHFLGDMPIYVAYDSADVWAHPALFQLDRDKQLTAVSGIPPTGDVPKGQLWGMPLYDWPQHERTRFKWWIQRIAHNLELYDWVRIDHFLGMANYWRIPADSMDPRKGQWIEGPRDKFFEALYRHFAALPIIAEDVGFVTLEARRIMDRYRLPGLRIVLDAFSRPAGDNAFAPHNHEPNAVVCTGTHDFNTARGWFDRAPAAERRQFFDYVGHRVPAARVAWEMVRLALESVCQMAIIPMQDILALGQEARMNTPGTPRGNWTWRMRANQATPALARRLRDLTRLTGRCE